MPQSEHDRIDAAFKATHERVALAQWMADHREILNRVKPEDKPRAAELLAMAEEKLNEGTDTFSDILVPSSLGERYRAGHMEFQQLAKLTGLQPEQVVRHLQGKTLTPSSKEAALRYAELAGAVLPVGGAAGKAGEAAEVVAAGTKAAEAGATTAAKLGILDRLRTLATGVAPAAKVVDKAAPAAAGMSKAAKVAIGLGTSGVALAGAKAAKDIYYDPWKEAKIEEMRDAPGGINEKKRAEAARANAFEMAMKNAETERTMQESALAERAKVEIAKFNSQAEIAKALIGMQQGPANAYAEMAKTAAQQAAYLPKASVDIFDAISLSPAKDPRFASIANAGAAAGSAPPNP